MVIMYAPSADIDFQGREQDEVFQFYFRQHWIRLLKPFLRTLGLTTVLVLLGYLLLVPFAIDERAYRHAPILVLSFLILVVQWEFLLRLYAYFLYVIVVTDRKVHRIKKTLFSFDDHQSLDMASLQDVHKWQHGPIQNLLGFGTLVLEAQNTTLRIHFTPRAAEMYNRLLHLKDMLHRKEKTLEKVPDQQSTPMATVAD